MKKRWIVIGTAAALVVALTAGLAYAGTWGGRHQPGRYASTHSSVVTADHMAQRQGENGNGARWSCDRNGTYQWMGTRYDCSARQTGRTVAAAKVTPKHQVGSAHWAMGTWQSSSHSNGHRWHGGNRRWGHRNGCCRGHRR